ncbi:MAG: hypothetical protein WAZ77_01530, partial [Candidatus Nitrosopolaris sp.]
PHILSRRLREVRATLEEIGIEIEFEHDIGTNKTRGVNVTKVASLASLASPEIVLKSLATDDEEQQNYNNSNKRQQNESLLCNFQVKEYSNATSNAKIEQKTSSNNLCRKDNSKCNSSNFKDSVSQPQSLPQKSGTSNNLLLERWLVYGRRPHIMHTLEISKL